MKAPVSPRSTRLPITTTASSAASRSSTDTTTNGLVNWTQAETEAVGLGGHLTAVNDAAENAYLVSTFLTGLNANKAMWIGFNDQTTEGTFVWSSGDAVTYTNWATGEPNNASNNEDYTAINWHFARGDAVPQGTWNDTPLGGTSGSGGNTNGPYRGIMEFTAAPANQPAWGASSAPVNITGEATAYSAIHDFSVTFSEDLLVASAQTPANYSLREAGAN